jgi:uncharacterized protein YdeI (YjbR/CyaY-like superfamily)
MRSPPPGLAAPPRCATMQGMNAPDGFETVHAANRDEWRAWLAGHHASEKGAWLVIHKKASREPSVTYDEAVEEALCFGWIDSRGNRMDETRYRQMFSPRKRGSVWAATNKVRVERLIAEGRMTPAGLALIDAAKADGSWDALNEVDALAMPDDLLGALTANSTAQRHFDAFPDSSKRIIMFWVTSAKRPETRAKRIAETVSLAEQNLRANHWRQPVDSRKKPAE